MNKYKLGKLPKKEDKRNLMFENYVKTLDPASISFDNLALVYSKLNISDPTILFPIDGNDTYGDCTCAGDAHGVTVWNGVLGINKIPTSEEVLALYNTLTNGQDTGCALLDVLKYLQKTGAFGEKVPAFVEVNIHNLEHIKLAISLFGGLYVGINVQENAESDFESGTTWTPGNLTGDGHCVYITSYDEEGVTILTWGNVIKGTWAWFKECVDEAYAILSQEFLDSNQELQSDLKKVQN